MLFNQFKDKIKFKTAKDKLDLAFIGTGFKGRNLLYSASSSGSSNSIFAYDIFQDALNEAGKLTHELLILKNFEEILNIDELDGVIVATPNFYHFEHCQVPLENNIAVFCQNPLGRTFKETKSLIQLAKNSDTLIDVEHHFKYTKALKAVHNILKEEEAGKIFAVDLIFHNTLGPGKKWFYDFNLSGGGCLINQGFDFLNSALNCLGYPEIKSFTGSLYAKGSMIHSFKNQVEDYASINLLTENEISINFECSWNNPQGSGVFIEAVFHGTKGSLFFKNVNGSDVDFTAELHKGSSTIILVEPTIEVMDKAFINWIEKLKLNRSFDNDIENYLKTASIIEKIYNNE